LILEVRPRLSGAAGNRRWGCCASPVCRPGSRWGTSTVISRA